MSLEVAAPLLVRLDHVVPPFCAVCIDEPTTFLLDVICTFYLYVVWEFTVQCYVYIFVEWINEVVVVVIYLDPLLAFTVLTDVNHEHFSIGGEAFALLALVFVTGRRERSAFLKREFAECVNGS
jgi:hypothetical protein